LGDFFLKNRFCEKLAIYRDFGDLSAIFTTLNDACRKLAISAFRPSRLQGEKGDSVVFRCTRCRENTGPGPTAVSGEFKTIKSKRDTWRAIGLLASSPIVTLKQKD
jgi:hypothetical protein